MRLFKNEVRSQAPDYELLARMDLDTLSPDAVADPAVRNAILLSRQKVAERAARQIMPHPKPRLREKFDRLIRSRRSRFSGMALVAALALGSFANFTGNDGTSEAAFQSSQPIPTAPETTTTTVAESSPLENTAGTAAEVIAPTVDNTTVQPAQEQRIFIRAGGTLWWEVDELFASAGLNDSACREVATRGIVSALRAQTGSDLNNVYAGQEFAVSQERIHDQLLAVAQNPACSIDA